MDRVRDAMREADERDDPAPPDPEPEDTAAEEDAEDA
jgi:hypothetical protein